MPPARDPDRPPSSTDLSDRLAGLWLILVGIVGFGAVYLLWKVAPTLMPAPAGLPTGMLPLLSPLNCMLPVVAIGSSALVLVGLRRLIFPE